MIRVQQQVEAECARLRSWNLERERRRLLVAALCNSFLQKALLRRLNPLPNDEDCCSDLEEEEEEEEDGEDQQQQDQEAQGEAAGCREYDPACDTVEEYVPACVTKHSRGFHKSGCGEEGREEDGHRWRERASELTEDSAEKDVPQDHTEWEEWNRESVWECAEECAPQDCGSKAPWGHLASECPGEGCDCIVVELPDDDSDSEDGADGGESRRWWERVCEKGWGHLESDCPGGDCDYIVVRLPSDDDDDHSEEEPE